MTSQHPTSLRETISTALATAVLSGGGGFMSALAGLPAGATAALCGLPLVVATVVASKRLGILSMAIYGVCCSLSVLKDLKDPGSLASSAFVMSSILATLALATARRRRHERTVVGLERLNHQVLGDPGRKIELRPETVKPKATESSQLHEATLIKLHEAGRRIATHSELDALVPIIITEARTLFRCSHVDVCFWNSHTRRLSRPYPERARDVGRYEPNPKLGAAAWVIATQQLFLAEAADRSTDLAAVSAGDPRRPAALIPLIAGNDMLGILVLDEPEDSAALSPMLLWTFANLCALGLRASHLVEQLAEASRRDPLTGFFDETGFAIAAEKNLAGIPSEHASSVIVAAFDNLTRNNDESSFNAVIAESARLWKAGLPQEAVVGQVGRDRFIAFLPKCPLSQAEQIAEELREAVASHPFGSNGQSLQLTCRFGVSAFSRHEMSIEDSVKIATRELNRAAADGGNRVCCAATETIAR